MIKQNKTNDSDASPFITQKDVILCRSGIQLYHKSEVASFITEDNKPAVEKDWYKEYRPANVIVKAKELFKSLPVTEEHPDVWVDSKNFKKLAGGTLDKDVDVVALEGEAEGEIGLKSNITFYTDELYNYYLNNKEVSVGYTCKKHFVPNPEEVGYGSEVAVIDSIIGGLKPMRTGIFAFITGKKQKNTDSEFSFGKTVLDAVKNSKGSTETELAGEMKGVLDSISVLKDCEAKDTLLNAVKDCFDNKEMAKENEAELTKTFDSMWEKAQAESLANFDSKDKEDEEDKTEDSKDEGKEEKNEDSKDKEDEEDTTEDSKDKESKEEKDGCHGNKDSAGIVASIMDSLKSELKPLVAEAVKECLGVKDDKSSRAEGGVVDSDIATGDVPLRDYTSFVD